MKMKICDLWKVDHRVLVLKWATLERMADARGSFISTSESVREEKALYAQKIRASRSEASKINLGVRGRGGGCRPL